MHRRALLQWACLPLGASLVGCATTRDNVDPQAANLSVVAGYIDMSDAPSPLGWVSIKAYGPGTDHHYLTRVQDGVFFHVGIENGSYQVDRFGHLGGLFSQPHEYAWGTQGRNPTALRIERPGVYVVGSYRYVRQKTGLLEAGKFRMEPLSTPSRKEVLQRVLKVIEGDAELRLYQTQIQRLRQAIAA